MTRVLIADDDDDIRTVVRDLLEDAGHQVCEACDGPATLEALRASQWPLVALVDVRLPTMGGLDVLRDIAADPSLVDRHGYILMSALDFGRLDDSARALLAEFGAPLLSKPFDIDDLLVLVLEVAPRVPATPPGPAPADGRRGRRRGKVAG